MVVPHIRERQNSFVNYSYNVTREIHHPLANQKKLLPRNLCLCKGGNVPTRKAAGPLGFASSLHHFLVLSEPEQANPPSNPCQLDTTISIWCTCFSPRRTGIMFWFIAESQYPVSWVVVLPHSLCCLDHLLAIADLTFNIISGRALLFNV